MRNGSLSRYTRPAGDVNGPRKCGKCERGLKARDYNLAESAALDPTGDLTNAQFPMLNSRPKWISHWQIFHCGRFSVRMRIEHWELNISQILPSPHSAKLFLREPLDWASAGPPTTFSPCLRDDIDQRRFAAFNGGDRAPERRPKILWIRDGSVGIHAQSLCQLREVNVGIGKRRSHGPTIDAAVALVAHALYVHDLLVIGPVVEHDAQERNAVVCRGPQDPRGIHQVSVSLDAHREAAVLLIGERRANGRRRAITNAAATRVAEPLIRFVEVPEPARPHASLAVVVRHERPIFIPDLRPYFGRDACRTQRAGVPRVCGCLPHTFARSLAGLGEFCAALLEHTLAITCAGTPNGFDQRRQCGLPIRGNRQIDVGHPSKILVVRPDVEIAGRDRSQFRAWFGGLSCGAMQLIA